MLRAMFTPWNIDCDTNTLRGQLKHSWLENQVLNKTSDNIISFWKANGWNALEQQFAVHIRKAIQLSDELESGFSPAQLVDTLRPFEKVDDETKELIKQAVHKAYLESSNITQLKAPLKEAAEEMEKALEHLLEAWNQQVSEKNEQELKKAWDKFLTRARKLHSVLEQLPKGIVLP